jgi:membrane-bound lytic murein transglycosylase D
MFSVRVFNVHTGGSAMTSLWKNNKWLVGFGVLSTALASSNGVAIDFKVELPPEKGVSESEIEGFFDEELSVTAAQGDVPVLNGNVSLDSAIPSPIPPAPPATVIAKATRSNKSVRRVVDENASQATGFPELSCLKDNVSFWKRVYDEVDVNQALIHDRDDLDKVYASVYLGGSYAQQRATMKLLREHYGRILNSLADKLAVPKSWNKTEKSIAKIFKPSELTRSRLKRASENIRIQQGLKSRFNAGVQRSLKYLPTIKPIISGQKLPMDIAYLPHVESSFVNHAKSKVGAVGLWQIMPNTMKRLMGRRSVGQRTNPKVATIAAAKLLKQNHQATKSWPLALTAYNHGLAGVLRAVRSTGSNDLCKIIARYDSPSFRFASSNFYAQFLAARQVALQRYSELSKNRAVGRIVAPLLASRNKGAL